MKAILISNDLRTSRDVCFCLQVRYEDCIIGHTDSGNHGLELVNIDTPEIVLIDSVLKDISILECIKRVRLISDVGILCVSEERPELDIVELLEAGVDDYIFKPVIPIEFLAKVRALLRLTRRQIEMSP